MLTYSGMALRYHAYLSLEVLGFTKVQDICVVDHLKLDVDGGSPSQKRMAKLWSLQAL
jgi:hypothetical protein